jgi:hypothetical protein
MPESNLAFYMPYSLLSNIEPSQKLVWFYLNFDVSINILILIVKALQFYLKKKTGQPRLGISGLPDNPVWGYPAFGKSDSIT